jgi:hypothetical protein
MTASGHVRNAAKRRKAAAKKPKTPGLAQAYGINPNDPNAFAAPMTLKQAVGAANAAGGEKYGDALQTLNTQIHETPLWYQQYKQSVQGAQQAAQKYQQGLVDQSNTLAQQVGQNILDGLQDKQAAASRQSLANLGTNVIQAIGQGNDQYFGARAGVADASQAAQMTNLLQQKRQTQKDRGNYATGVLNDLRTGATNASIARDTLNANVSNQQTDNAINAAKVTQGARDKAASRAVTIRGQNIGRRNVKTRVAAQTQAKLQAQAIKDQAAQAKKKETIGKATGKIQVKVHDIITDWAGGASVDVTDKTGKPTGKTRPATRQELRGAMDGKHGRAWVEIALKVRDGKPLTHTEIGYLHAQDPNIRIPKGWLKGRTQPKPRVGSAPLAPGANGQMRPT